MPRTVWQPAQRARHEHVAAAPLDSRLRRRAPAAASPSSQRSNSRFRLGDDVEGHVRVLQAAELGALAAEDARAIGLQPDRGGVAGNQVALAVQVRRPEAVDDVARRDLEHDRPVDRNVDLVRRRAPGGSGLASSYAISHHH